MNQAFLIRSVFGISGLEWSTFFVVVSSKKCLLKIQAFIAFIPFRNLLVHGFEP